MQSIVIITRLINYMQWILEPQYEALGDMKNVSCLKALYSGGNALSGIPFTNID